MIALTKSYFPFPPRYHWQCRTGPRPPTFQRYTESCFPMLQGFYWRASLKRSYPYQDYTLPASAPCVPLFFHFRTWLTPKVRRIHWCPFGVLKFEREHLRHKQLRNSSSNQRDVFRCANTSVSPNLTSLAGLWLRSPFTPVFDASVPSSQHPQPIVIKPRLLYAYGDTPDYLPLSSLRVKSPVSQRVTSPAALEVFARDRPLEGDI